jgi:hypothetical protein
VTKGTVYVHTHHNAIFYSMTFTILIVSSTPYIEIDSRLPSSTLSVSTGFVRNYTSAKFSFTGGINDPYVFPLISYIYGNFPADTYTNLTRYACLLTYRIIPGTSYYEVSIDTTNQIWFTYIVL